MVIIEKTDESDIYIFNSGTANEIRLEWKREEGGLPRQSPPFMLEGDILSYVKEIDSILRVTKGDNLEIVEKRYRGLNNVLSRLVQENEGYICDIEVRGSECGDWIGIVCGGILGEGGVDSSCKSLETVLPRIKKLVDSKHAFIKVKGEVLSVSDWWLKERDLGLFPGVVVLYELWMYLNIKVEETHHLFEKIGHKVENVTPAYITYRLMEKAKNWETRIQSELNHPVYTVTAIRYHMGDHLSSDEKTAAAEKFLSGLKKGQKVILVAEPDNPADPNAIAAYINYNRVGYITRENTNEVSRLLNSTGQCDGVVEQTDGHITLFISIPGAPEGLVLTDNRSRQLQDNPLGDDVRMPFSNDENRLQLIANRLIRMEINTLNIQEIIQMVELYIPLMKLSVCYEDTLWRDKISKILYRICQCLQSSSLNIGRSDAERVRNLYKKTSDAIGDMRSPLEHWPEYVFVEHLDRLRNDSGINQHLYKKYCDAFLDGKDFVDADKELVTKEYERLCGWLKGMRWEELRDPDGLPKMGLKVNNLGLSRQELYDLYSVLLIIEKLKGVMAIPDNKINTTSYISRNKYDTLPDSRKKILNELLSLTEKGDWVQGVKAEDIKGMVVAALGIGNGTLSDKHAELSSKLWTLLEKGRKGDSGRVRIIWENIVGFLDERHLFKQKGASALDKDFFGDRKGYTNIDKGRPKRDDMSKGFNEILPLLEAFAPKSPMR